MSYSDEEIQLHIAQESSRFWKWNQEWLAKNRAHSQTLIPGVSGLRILDAISHRGTGKIRGDKRGNNLGMTKAKWQEIGRRRRGR